MIASLGQILIAAPIMLAAFIEGGHSSEPVQNRLSLERKFASPNPSNTERNYGRSFVPSGGLIYRTKKIDLAGFGGDASAGQAKLPRRPCDQNATVQAWWKLRRQHGHSPSNL